MLCHTAGGLTGASALATNGPSLISRDLRLLQQMAVGSSRVTAVCDCCDRAGAVQRAGGDLEKLSPSIL